MGLKGAAAIWRLETIAAGDSRRSDDEASVQGVFYPVESSCTTSDLL